jgi:hypothetical protein
MRNHRKKRRGIEVQANKHHRTGIREEEEDPEQWKKGPARHRPQPAPGEEDKAGGRPEPKM